MRNLLPELSDYQKFIINELDIIPLSFAEIHRIVGGKAKDLWAALMWLNEREYVHFAAMAGYPHSKYRDVFLMGWVVTDRGY